MFEGKFVDKVNFQFQNEGIFQDMLVTVAT